MLFLMRLESEKNIQVRLGRANNSNKRKKPVGRINPTEKISWETLNETPTPDYILSVPVLSQS